MGYEVIRFTHRQLRDTPLIAVAATRRFLADESSTR
ncbi:MAG: hypothetical protein QOG26_82 [Solirubrobacterales bacterium]|nr:hypothetical protein [Solirubrobacterales bacterium]